MKLIGELERYKTLLHHLFRDEGYIAKSKVKFTAINGGSANRIFRVRAAPALDLQNFERHNI